MNNFRSPLFLAVFCILSLCVWWWWWPAPVYLPKPVGHPRIALPAQVYTSIKQGLPYCFERSQHAVLKTNKGGPGREYWIDLYYPAFDATIKLTYKPVKQDLRLLREYCYDAYKLTAKHQVKASAIRERTLTTKRGYSALVAELEGEVPSQVQFHVIGGKEHFLRGALYFNTATQNDFLAPVIAFIRRDIDHLLETLLFRP